MKIVNIGKTVRFIIVGLTLLLAISSIVGADEFVNRDNHSGEVIIKGTVVKAEDVCGIIVEDNIYIIPCDQVDGFDEKMVNAIGVVTEEGDVQSIDATSVQTIE